MHDWFPLVTTYFPSFGFGTGPGFGVGAVVVVGTVGTSVEVFGATVGGAVCK